MKKNVKYDPMDERFACCTAAIKRIKTVPFLARHERNYKLGAVCKTCKRWWFVKKDGSTIAGPYTVL